MDAQIQGMLVQIVSYTIEIAIILVGGFIVRYLKKQLQKIDELGVANLGETNYKTAKSIALDIVSSIEKQYKDKRGVGDLKFSKVLTDLNTILESRGIILTEEEKKHLIESAVFAISQVKENEIKNTTTPTIENEQKEKVE